MPFAQSPADLGEGRAVYVCEGRDQPTVQAFSSFLKTHGGEVARVEEVSQDMSEAYLAGTLKHLPQADITFDLYDVRQHPSNAVAEIRGEEAKQHKQVLKNTRYLWLKRPKNPTARQQDLLDELPQQPLQTVRAYELSLRFDDFHELDDPDAAEEYLRRWIAEVHTSGLQPMIEFTRMLEDNWLRVMRWASQPRFQRPG